MVHKGNGVQVIYGPRVTVVKSNLEDYLETAPDEEYAPAGNAGADSAAPAEDKPAGKVVKSDIIYSPVNGTAADLSETPDEAFAGRMMGDGAMVIPEDGEVRAPEDGEVSFVFDTKHAVGFLTESGISLLIHVGIDTVKLNGEGFKVFVENGQKVKKGDPLLELDLEFLKENAPSITSPVLCPELTDKQKVRLLKEGTLTAGEELFAVDFYE